MGETNLYVSHGSALHYWRTNPPQYVLEGADRNIRVLRCCPSSNGQIRDFCLSEDEFGKSPIDVLVPPGAPRPRSVLRYHIQKAKLPPRSLFPIRDGIHVASPTLCFVQLCSRLEFAEAAELGMEFCGTYALRPESLEGAASRNYQLMSASSCRRKVDSWKEMHGLARARVVAKYLTDGSASPMESKLYLLLCLPQLYGGYNLEKPRLNVEIELPERERLILRQRSVKPDLLWQNHRLLVEYNGEYHDDPIQKVKDDKRRVVLESLGYTVFTIRKQQVYDPLAFDNFATTVAKKVGKRLRPLTLKQQLARESLRERLVPTSG